MTDVARRAAWALAAITVTVACAAERERAPVLSGVVAYDPDIRLPPDARLVVILADVSVSDAPVVLIEDTVEDLTSGVVPFEVRYNHDAIDPQRVYAVAARVVLGGDVLLATAESEQVLTQGTPDRVELTVVPAGAMGPLPPRAATIALRLGGYQRVDGTWEHGDATSAINAYFEAGALRYVEERMTIRAGGSAANAYYFDQDALFYHETVKRLAVDASGTRDEVAFRVLFAADGEIEHVLKWQNGAPAELDDGELQATLFHAALIREAALRLAAQADSAR